MNLQIHSINPLLSNTNSSYSDYFPPQRRLFVSAGNAHTLKLCRPSYISKKCSLKTTNLEFQRRAFALPKFIQNQPKRSHMRIKAASSGSLSHELFIRTSENDSEFSSYNAEDLQPSPKYENRFLIFARFGSFINNAAESFFKSEIRRRLFVTAALLVISRIGYFIPLPGFDRRLVPENYLSFVSGSVEELGELAPELKLSLFQLGISPQIGASIVMQVLCYVIPSLVKLRKEGLDANEKIKSYTWWLAFGFAIVEALIISYFSLSYSIYAANAAQRTRHVMFTTMYLVSGAMTTTWICDKISDSGFGITFEHCA